MSWQSESRSQEEDPDKRCSLAAIPYDRRREYKDRPTPHRLPRIVLSAETRRPTSPAELYAWIETRTMRHAAAFDWGHYAFVPFCDDRRQLRRVVSEMTPKHGGTATYAR